MDWLRNFNTDFDDIVARFGQRTALIAAGETEQSLSYAELDALIDRYAAWLGGQGGQGVEGGDCVGAILPNSLDMLALFLACLRGGLRFAPLACDTAPAELTRWAELVQPRCCCYSPLLAPAVIESLRATGLACVPVEADGRFAHLPPPAAPAARRGGARLYLYSSGTTGAPKAIVLDADRLWSAGHAFAREHGAGFEHDFRIWNYLPQSYLGGLFNMALIPFTVAGSAVVDEIFSGRTFLSFWQTLDRYDINVLWFVPTIVRGLLAMGERTQREQIAPRNQRVGLAFLGTAPIERATKDRFEAMFGIPLLENFALSETTFLSSEFPAESGLRAEGSVGRRLPYAQMRFRPLAGEDSRYSEIMVRTPFLMLGYQEEGGEPALALDPDGFFATGDLGYLDANGQLILTGRSKDVIKKGGYFIALREVELIAMQHAWVQEAAAIPVAHSFYGESYRLCVRLKPGAPDDAQTQVSDHVFSSLAKHKWPESVDAVEDFPRTASGKVRKFLLHAAS